jgi:prophage antirepressor-like protein
MLNITYNEGKNEDGFYIPLTEANTFINKIADEYDDSFKQITIYGSNEYPLFILKDVRGILDIPRKTFEDNIKKFEKNLEILEKCKVQLITKRKDTEYKQNREDVDMLTKYGVYHAMFISDKPIAQMFRKFVYIILDKLEKEKVVRLEDAQNDLRKQLELEKKAYNKLNDRNLQIEGEIIKMQPIIERHVEYVDIMQDREMFAMTGNQDYKILQLMYEMHATKTPIYIVNPEYVIEKYISIDQKKKNKNESTTKISKKKCLKEKKSDDKIFSSDEEDNIININQLNSTNKLENIDPNYLQELYQKYNILEYDHDWRYCNIQELEDELDNNYYFALHTFKSQSKKNPKHYRKIADIWIIDNKHYNLIIEQFNNYPYSHSSVKKVFNIGWNNIKDIQKTTLVNRLNDLKKKNKD